MKNYFSELIGTFALVFCGTGAIVINDISGGAVTHLGIAISFGLVVMAMIYAFGETSGAHINPAVTLSFWLGGQFPLKKVLPYILFQLIGGILASLSLHFLFPTHEGLGATIPFGSDAQSFILEVILSYFLMLVIFKVSNRAKESGEIAGLAIGGTVLLEALFAGPITGASMNPVRSIGPALISGNVEQLWIYILAPIMGMLLALVTYKLIKK